MVKLVLVSGVYRLIVREGHPAAQRPLDGLNIDFDRPRSIAHSEIRKCGHAKQLVIILTPTPAPSTSDTSSLPSFARPSRTCILTSLWNSHRGHFAFLDEAPFPICLNTPIWSHFHEIDAGNGRRTVVGCMDG